MCFRLCVVGTLTVLLCGIAEGQQPAGSRENIATNSLILEKQEGERRVHRPAGTSTGTAPFILKFDPENGPSKHLIYLQAPPSLSTSIRGVKRF